MSARRHLAVAALVGIAGAAAASLIACNSVLGIDPAEVEPCNDYCTKIAKTCVGQNKQYMLPEVCLAMCANLEPGAPGAVSGNSLACRMTHVGLAVGDPVTHCPHAGPLGAGTCGTSCEGFCLQNVALCRPPNPRAFTDQNECLNECNAGTTGPFRFTSGTGIDAEETQTTDDLNCRIYHLERAYEATLAPTHCPHTARVSTVCVKRSLAGDAGAVVDAHADH